MRKELHKNSFIEKLNTKKILKELSQIYEVSLKCLESKFFYKKQNDKIFMSDFDFDIIDFLDEKRVVNFGIYFATLNNFKKLRLSVEGSKYFLEAQKNFAIIEKNSLKKYLSQKDLEEKDFEKIEKNSKTNYLIVKFENKTLGIIDNSKGRFLNYIPKSRKIDEDKIMI